MFLLKVYYLDGRKEIISHDPNENGPFKLPEGAYGTGHFKYEYKHPILPPTLGTFISGKRYIVPGWIEVHPDTQLSDVKWVKENIKQEKTTWEFKSSSSNGKYTVTKVGDKLKCNCMGFFRAKDRRCKHIKSVEKEINKMSKI